MANTNRVELTGHTPRSRGRVRSGLMSVVGIPFMVAGAGTAWLVDRHPEGARAPLPIVYGVCALFFLAGFALSLGGILSIIRRQRIARRMRAHPDEPWLGDHAWNPDGERERPFRKTLQGLVGLFGFALFLTPFNWWMITDLNIFLIAIVGLFDLILVVSVGYWLYEIAHALKYGAASIRYDRFPFFLGERLGVRLGCRGSLARFDKIVATLRFVRESVEHRGNSPTTVCTQHWAETAVFPTEQLANASELPVSFGIPSDPAFDTCLTESPACYWEIELRGEAPGIDFQSSFPVPVYKR